MVLRHPHYWGLDTDWVEKMENFITLTLENLDQEHLCCIIRSKKPHPGVEAKRAWLAGRLPEGHVFRKLDAKGCCFIEYAPLETAWVPIVGSNFYYIYCLWVDGTFKSHGYGTQLMESCIADAKAKGASGICMLGAKKQKGWLSDQNFAKKFGFVPVDTTADGYALLALSFDGTAPRFTDKARRQSIDGDALTIYYTMQCPFILQKVAGIRENCPEVNLIPVDSLEKAKDLPGVFNNFAVFYKGKLETVNLLDATAVQKLQKK